jgi:SAM-dependent methyltransferase
MSSNQYPACLLCDHDMDVRYELPHIWHQPRRTRPYTISWCNRCDLGLLLPRPLQKEVDGFYGETYFTQYEGRCEAENQDRTDLAPDFPTMLDRLRVHIAWRSERRRPLDASDLGEVIGSAPSRICDIGCGAGQVLADLKALGHNVVGIEADIDARRRAAAKGIDVFPGYAEDLPKEIKGRPFDLVSMMHVLEHCIDPIQALRNATALLRPGGYLVVEVPNNESIIAQHLGLTWFHCDAGRHLNFFTAQSLAKVVECLDFEIIGHRFGGYVSAFVNNRVVAERVVWDSLYGEEDASAFAGPRNSKLRQWMMLARTLFASPARKYEAVAIIARRRE